MTHSLTQKELNRATLARQMLLARENLGFAVRTHLPLVINDDHRRRVTTANLRILPTFLVDGIVSGTWRIERQRSSAALILEPFVGLSRKARVGLTDEGTALVRFAEPDSRAVEAKMLPLL